MIHKPKCEIYDINTIRTSSDSHLYCKDHFHKNLLYFWIIADFEADNEIDNTAIGNKTTDVYKQNPILNGYHIISELDAILKGGYYESLLGYDKVDWYVNEVTKLEKEWFSILKTPRQISL